MFFCFVQKNIFGQHKSQNIYYFLSRIARFFFQNLTLGYMTKTLNQIIFFSSTKIRIFFSATLGIRIFFQKKTITPPPFQGKWSFPKDTSLPGCHADFKTIGGAFYPFYAAFRIVVQVLNNSPRFVLNCCMVHTPEQM